MSNIVEDIRDEMDAAIEYALKRDIIIDPSNFQVIDGWLYIDSMDPIEWIDSMVMP